LKGKAFGILCPIWIVTFDGLGFITADFGFENFGIYLKLSNSFALFTLNSRINGGIKVFLFFA
jgi:hypothetical protein